MSARSLRRWIFASMLSVIVLGGLAETLAALGVLAQRSAWLAFLSLSYEQNLPTFYAVAQLLCCAALLAAIAGHVRARRERHVWHWRLLALGFAYIALDEMAELHERTGFLELDGVLYFSWVVPAAIVVMVLGAIYLPFLLALRAKLRWRFIIAGAIYVGGAVLMELPLGYWTERHGSSNAGYALIDWIEESLELLGISLFLLALTGELARRGWSLSFSQQPADQDPEPIADSS